MYKKNGFLSLSVLFVSLVQIPMVQSQKPVTSFGKTHFIIGMKPADYVSNSEQSKSAPERQYAARNNVSVHGANKTQVFFSPDDDVQAVLLDLINREQKSIRIAIFIFTDDALARALIAAKHRGVAVELIVEPSKMKERYSKIALLQREGISVFEYNPEYNKDKRSNIMHHKFIIFGSADSAVSFVWTGSFNFTQSAGKRNQENAIIMYDSEVVKQFSMQYDLLKTRSIFCGKICG